MNQTSKIAKRILNVAFLAAVIWSAFVAATGIAGIFRQKMPWEDWILQGLFTSLGAYLALAAINYVIFGKPRLWHKIKADPQA